jgi:hypothetical protein
MLEHCPNQWIIESNLQRGCGDDHIRGCRNTRIPRGRSSYRKTVFQIVPNLLGQAPELAIWIPLGIIGSAGGAKCGQGNALGVRPSKPIVGFGVMKIVV